MKKPRDNEHEIVVGVIEGMIRQAPDGVVSKIFAESLPAGTDAAEYTNNILPDKGFIPGGKTLKIVQEVLTQAPIKQGPTGVNDIRDLAKVPRVILNRDETKTNN